MAEYESQCVVWQTALNPVIALELLATGVWAGARRARPRGVRRGAVPRAHGTSRQPTAATARRGASRIGPRDHRSVARRPPRSFARRMTRRMSQTRVPASPRAGPWVMNSMRCSPGSSRRGARGAAPTARWCRRSTTRATPLLVAVPAATGPAVPAMRADPQRSRRAPRRLPPSAPLLGFLGWHDGLHLHSHMNAVDPAARGRGIGLALKLRQRALCLEHGVAEVRWTYDPLIRRNARMNLVRLGAEVIAFHPDFYGASRRRHHGHRPQRPLRGALAPRLPAHGARARRSNRSRPGRRAAASRSSPISRGCERMTRPRPRACASSPGRPSQRWATAGRDFASSSTPPATTSSRPTTPTGRPDERVRRHE